MDFWKLSASLCGAVSGVAPLCSQEPSIRGRDPQPRGYPNTTVNMPLFKKSQVGVPLLRSPSLALFDVVRLCRTRAISTPTTRPPLVMIQSFPALVPTPTSWDTTSLDRLTINDWQGITLLSSNLTSNNQGTLLSNNLTQTRLIIPAWVTPTLNPNHPGSAER